MHTWTIYYLDGRQNRVACIVRAADRMSAVEQAFDVFGAVTVLEVW